MGDSGNIAPTAGDPVSLDQGRVRASETDYAAAPPSPLAFIRYYDSSSTLLGKSGGSLGQNWTHNFDIHLAQTTVPYSTPLRLPYKVTSQPSDFPWGYDFSQWTPATVDPHTLAQSCPTGQVLYVGSCFPLLPPVGYSNDPALMSDPVTASDGSQSCAAAENLLYQNKCHPVLNALPSTIMVIKLGARRLYFTYQAQSIDSGGGIIPAHKAIRPGTSVPHAVAHAARGGGGSITTVYVWLPDGNVSAKLANSSAITPNGWQFTDENDDVYNFDANFKLLSKVQRNGVTLSFTTDAHGNVQTVTDNFGRTLTLGYASSGLLSTVTQPDGQVIQYGYLGTDRNAVLQTVTYPDGTQRKYDYQMRLPLLGNTALLKTITDENGQVFSSWTYDAITGRAKTAANGDGVNQFTFNYTNDAGGTVTGVTTTDPNGVQHVYGMASKWSANVPTSEQVAGASTITHSDYYDNNGNLQVHTDYNGTQTQHYYDQTRNLEIQRTDAANTPLQRMTCTRWSPTFRIKTAIYEPLRITSFNLDAQGNVLTRTEQDSSDTAGSQCFDATPTGTPRSWSYTYTTVGQVKTVTDPLQHTTTNSYDPSGNGNLIGVSNALNQATTYGGYDANGRVGTVTDPNGVVATLYYDARGRLKQIDRSNGGLRATTRYGFDAAGQLKTVTDPDGVVVSYDYDAAHRRKQVTDAQGNTIAYSPDNAGNIKDTKTFDASGTQTRWLHQEYDAFGRLQSTAAGGMAPTTYGYDANGNRTTVTEPDGTAGTNRVTTSGYDALNRLQSVLYPGNQGSAGYQYDGLDQLTQVTDPRKLATSYTVDGLGNQTVQTSPDTGTTTRTFYADGSLHTSTDAKGQTTSYAYDALGRVQTISYADGSSVGYTYDTAQYGIGKLALIQEFDAAKTLLRSTQYQYDPLGRVNGETHAVAGKSYQTGYGYTLAGRLHTLSYPSGRVITYDYDKVGRVQTVTLTDTAGLSKTLASQIGYQPFGPLASYLNSTGQSIARGFDTAGRATTYTLGGVTYQYGYDNASRPNALSNLLDAKQSVSWGYDVLDHLTSATLPTSYYQYGYDANGNRTSNAIGTAQSTFNVSPTSNQLSSITGANPRSFGYDPNGSMTQDGKNGYRYDARGRLFNVSTAQGSVGLEVNALGQRVRKTSSLGDTVFHYDLGSHLLSESSADGSVLKDYVWLGDTPIAVLQ